LIVMKPHSIAIVLAVSTVSSASLSQVNVEVVRGDANRQGISGRVEANVTGNTGNTEGVIAGGSGRLQYRRRKHLVFFHAAGGYTRLNHSTSVERFLFHARYNYEIAPWVWLEAFGQVEHDAFRRLTNRELLGAGWRFRLVETEAIDLFYGTSYMSESENVNLADSDPHQSLTLAHRWNHYLTFSASLSQRLDTGFTAYVQPRFDQFSDYRILHESFFEVGISDVVSTRLSTWMRYDSDPPQDVKKADFRITNAFVAKF